MSLAKLLSTGKSLVGGSTDNASRYRMGSPGLLPKFGSAPKPVQDEPKALPAVEREPMKRTLETEQDRPADAPLPKKKSPVLNKSWWSRLKARMARSSIKPARREVSRLAKTPVQVELSLDKVRVVRNDLSDSDLEIVPRRDSQFAGAMTSASAKPDAAKMDCPPRAAKDSTVTCEPARK